jgi:glycosyltransferase involved in cell wall biosynthesis
MYNRIALKLKQLKEMILNFIFRKDVYYIVENADWSIKHDGVSITSNLKGVKAKITVSDLGIYNKIIHYGSINSFYFTCLRRPFLRPHKSNKIIVTWFHINPGDKRIQTLIENESRVDKWHTSCKITKQEMIEIGIPANKIEVIPLGVDLKNFYVDEKKKQAFRKEHNFDKDSLVIGSFQKDGEGWGEGLKPKLIKGPDVFCDAVSALSKQYDVFVVLTGPARGYVKKRLEQEKIPYIHSFFDQPGKVRDYYQLIDLYLVTSRVEGGPKSILESMASNVPIISTRVGMAPDVIENGKNGYVLPVEDTDGIVNTCISIAKDSQVKKQIVENASNTVLDYDWTIISQKYKTELYNDLLR